MESKSAPTVVDFDVSVTRRQDGVLHFELFVDGHLKLTTISKNEVELSSCFISKSAVGVMRLKFHKI